MPSPHAAPDGAPELSVIIPVHDGADVIGLQLASLVAQIDAPRFEVVVVDNRSSDFLAGAIEPFREELDIRVVPAPERPGAAYARNVGIGAARAEHLLFLDADDSADPYAVLNTHRTLLRRPVFSGSAVPIAPEELAEGLPAARRIAPGTPDWSEPVPESPGYPILCGGVFGIRCATAREIGGMDAAFPWGGEDNDLAIRLTRAGHAVDVSKVVSIAYRQRPPGSVSARAHLRAGFAHAQLCTRHGLWGRTPSTRGGRWILEPARALAAAALAVVRPGRASRADLVSRFATASGLLLGRIRFAAPALLPRPLIGCGLRPPTAPERI